MAFEARVEFWSISDGGDGVAAPMLDSPISDALTLDENISSAIDLPSQRDSYAMYVFGLSGSFVVIKSRDGSEDPNKGRLVRENTSHWFLVREGDKLAVVEYV